MKKKRMLAKQENLFNFHDEEKFLFVGNPIKIKKYFNKQMKSILFQCKKSSNSFKTKTLSAYTPGPIKGKAIFDFIVKYLFVISMIVSLLLI